MENCVLYAVEPLLWDTSIQGSTPFRGQKIWPWENSHIIFVFVTSIEGTPLFRGWGHFFWVPKPEFYLHSGDTLALKTWLTTMRVDFFCCTLVTMLIAFMNWTISLKSMYCTSVNWTYNVAEMSQWWLFLHWLRWLIIRDFKIWRRDGNKFVKKSHGFNKQNNNKKNFARASPFFVHFVAVSARIRPENDQFNVLWSDCAWTSAEEILFLFLKFDMVLRNSTPEGVHLHLSK